MAGRTSTHSPRKRSPLVGLANHHAIISRAGINFGSVYPSS